MDCGAQYVIPCGTTRMLEWCVENWDIMDVGSFMYIPSSIYTPYIFHQLGTMNYIG